MQREVRSETPAAGPERVVPARRRVETGFLGRVPYRDAERLQARLQSRVLDGGQEALLLLEHPHVVTLGRSASRLTMIAAESFENERGVEVVETDRGGQATYHGPGQLVGYPILDLKPDRRDVRRYVRDLSQVLIEVLAELSIAAEPGGGERPIGVWVGERKIASIGVHLKRWVTTHGFALNVTTDLSYFGVISPCGLPASTMTSIEALTGQRPTLEVMAEKVARHFGVVFERELATGDLETGDLETGDLAT